MATYTITKQNEIEIDFHGVKLVVCKINNYTDISHYVILNTPKFTEVFRDGKINTISAFRRRS